MNDIDDYSHGLVFLLSGRCHHSAGIDRLFQFIFCRNLLAASHSNFSYVSRISYDAGPQK